LKGLKARGVEAYVLSDVAVLGNDFLDGLRTAVVGADLVVAVLDENALDPSFEAGFAVALGKPLLVVATPGTDFMGDISRQLVVQARPDAIEAVNFVLDHAERHAKSVSRSPSGPSEHGLGLALAARLFKQFDDTVQNERNVLKLVKEVIEGSGAIVAENRDRDAQFDLGVWSDDLAAIGGNPLVVEIRKHLTAGVTDQVLQALSQHPTARLALIVHLDSGESATESSFAPYPILSISIRGLIARMESASFAEVVRDLRNRSVHGVPSS
jgi:hypothetical protein